MPGEILATCIMNGWLILQIQTEWGISTRIYLVQDTYMPLVYRMALAQSTEEAQHHMQVAKQWAFDHEAPYPQGTGQNLLV